MKVNYHVVASQCNRTMPICWIFQIFQLFWLMNFNSVVLAYDFVKCPNSWQWNLRAKALCNISHGKYSCLYDVIQHKYIESCLGKPDYVKPGKRYVIRGNWDNDNCIESRYQPFKLWSNQSSDCDFLKNHCSEMGQVVVSNGTTTEDSTCQCDYTRGFNFVSKPKNVCYCIPSEEDCSCYHSTCSADELLKTDNACNLKVNLEIQNGRCSSIVEIRKPLFVTSPTIRPKPTRIMDDSYQIMRFKTAISVMLVITIACSCIFLAYNMLEETLMNRLMEYCQPSNFISSNKSFLVKEMEVEIMGKALLKKTGNQCYAEIPDDIPRKEKAILICDHLAKEQRNIQNTIYEICKEEKWIYLLQGLTGSTVKSNYAYEINERRTKHTTLNIIAANKTFLIEELDTETMRLKLYVKTGKDSFLEVPNTASRIQKSRLLCDMIEKELPDILDTFYEILKECKMYLVLHRLQAYTRIYSYTHETVLQRMMAVNFKEIVECLIEKSLGDEIIAYFEDRQILQQKVDTVCKNFYNDEKKKISGLIELVMKDGLHSMLHFVNALFIVGEESYVTLLLRIPAENN